MGIIRDAFFAGLGFPRKLPDPDFRDHPTPSRLQTAMRNVEADDDRRKIVLAQSGEERPTFGLRTTPPPMPARAPIDDMVSVMVPKRDSGLIADIIRTRMAGGTPQVIDGSQMSPPARAIAYTLATADANSADEAIIWLRDWNDGDPEAEKEMEAYEND